MDGKIVILAFCVGAKRDFSDTVTFILISHVRRLLLRVFGSFGAALLAGFFLPLLHDISPQLIGKIHYLG